MDFNAFIYWYGIVVTAHAFLFAVVCFVVDLIRYSKNK